VSIRILWNFRSHRSIEFQNLRARTILPYHIGDAQLLGEAEKLSKQSNVKFIALARGDHTPQISRLGYGVTRSLQNQSPCLHSRIVFPNAKHVCQNKYPFLIAGLRRSATASMR